MPANTERFVRTREIRAAVKGRESDILDALGIAWRNGRPHIACPYPNHDDHDPSWRFDTRTGRAFCTCINGPKSDDIFDVVMKLKRLDFDAPLKNGKNNRPVLVGHWPCAVFETIAADGRTHAHRIYVATDYSGKAELGQEARGRERDPKKSAQRDPQGPSTAGCCVVWGNPDTEHVILAEGIENACAIACSFRDEIDKGERAVLSAISAFGIEAFVPWAATRRITIAADRDEDKPGAGFKRGERAARTLGMRLAKEAENRGRQIETLIALPGESGTGYDFLDLFHAEDLAGVRNTILAAVPFQPTAKEIAEWERLTALQNEIAKLNRTFPLPRWVTPKLQYRPRAWGELWVHKFLWVTKDKETGEEVEVWAPICSPFSMSAWLRLVDDDDAYGVRVLVADHKAAPRALDFQRGELSRLGASEIRSRLMDAGMRVANGGEDTIVEVLKEAAPTEELDAVSATGWQGDRLMSPEGEELAK